MFLGQFHVNLDSKGRLVVPAKFRDELQDNFYLAHGFDGNLAIYTAAKFEAMLMQVSQMPITKKKSRDYFRVLTARSVQCVPDKAGRINIPDELAKEVGLKKECVVVGVFDRIEIWDKDNWDNYYNDTAANFEAIAESLDRLPGEEDE